MVINLEQKKIHFDLRFILTYNIYTCIYIGFYKKSSLSIIISSLFINFLWHVCKVAN